MNLERRCTWLDSFTWCLTFYQHIIKIKYLVYHDVVTPIVCMIFIFILNLLLRCQFSCLFQDSIDLFLGNFAVDESDGPSPLRVQKDWKFLTVSVFEFFFLWSAVAGTLTRSNLWNPVSLFCSCPSLCWWHFPCASSVFSWQASSFLLHSH